MYISIKTIRIILALLFAGIILLNLSLSNNNDIPDAFKRKVEAASIIAIILIVIFQP